MILVCVTTFLSIMLSSSQTSGDVQTWEWECANTGISIMYDAPVEWDEIELIQLCEDMEL